jgi:lysophospholipase L1-like esterase
MLAKEQKTRRPLSLREYVYLVVILFLFLLALEASIRLYYWIQYGLNTVNQSADAPQDPFAALSYRAHPFLHYVPNPQSPGIDSNYFRSTPVVEHPRHVVVTLGESSTYGQGVDAKMTYSSRLQDMLNVGDDKYVVLNGGVPGWSIPHQLARYVLQLRHLRPKPDMIVIYSGYNDARTLLSPNSSASAYEDVLRPFDGDTVGWWRRSRLLGFVASHVRQLSCRWIGDDLGIRVHLNDFAFKGEGCLGSFPAVPLNPVRVEEFRRDLEALVRLAKLDGVAVVLVKQDSPSFDNKSIGPAFFRARDLVGQVGVAEGVTVVDMHDYLNSRPENFFDEIHPSVQGHEIIAKTLAPVVRKILQ